MEYIKIIDELLERGRISKTNHVNLKKAITKDIMSYGEQKYIQGVSDGIAHAERLTAEQSKKNESKPKKNTKTYKAEFLIKEHIERYKDVKFNNGSVAEKEYETFEKRYLAILQEISRSINGSNVAFNNGHYYFSAFIQRGKHFVYLSINDVRYAPNEWMDKILIRTANDPNDYLSGTNEFTTLIDLPYNLDRLLT